MDIIRPGSAFVTLASASLKSEDFNLIDVGCGGGLAPGWRSFGSSLRAVGFDGLAGEVARLTEIEENPKVRYVSGLVAAERLTRTSGFVTRNPWPRLAVSWWLERERAKASHAAVPAGTSSHSSPSEQPARSLAAQQVQRQTSADALGAKIDIFDTANETGGQEAGQPTWILLAEYLRNLSWPHFDFIKIDVDGPDFDLLRAIAPVLEESKVFGLGLEVNFIGGPDPEENTFANVDLLLRRSGFDLFSLSARKYASSAFPGRGPHPYPAETNFGRLFQGDALYARDICSPLNERFAASASPEALLRYASVFALFGLPDCAAEILLKFYDRISTIFDIEQGLDVLVAEFVPDQPGLTYDEYMEAFLQRAPYFNTLLGVDVIDRSNARTN